MESFTAWRRGPCHAQIAVVVVAVFVIVLGSGCEATSRTQADTAVGRGVQVNPNAVARKEPERRPVKPLPRVPVVDALRTRSDALVAALRQLLVLQEKAPAGGALSADVRAHLGSVATSLGLEWVDDGCGAWWRLRADAADAVIFRTYAAVDAPRGRRPSDVPAPAGAITGPNAGQEPAAAVAMMFAAAAWRDARALRPFHVEGHVSADRHADGTCAATAAQRGTPAYAAALDGAFPVTTARDGLAAMAVAQRAAPFAQPPASCVPAAVALEGAPALALACVGARPTPAAGVRADEDPAAPGRFVIRVDNLPTGSPALVTQAWLALARAVTADPVVPAQAPGVALLRAALAVADGADPAARLGLEAPRDGHLRPQLDILALRLSGPLWTMTLRASVPPPNTVDGVAGAVRAAVAPLPVLVDGAEPHAVDNTHPLVLPLLRAWKTASGVEEPRPVVLTTPGFSSLHPFAVAWGPRQDAVQEDAFILPEELLRLAVAYALGLAETAAAVLPGASLGR